MFKSLIRRPIAVLTALVAILILGVAVITQLPVSLVPEIDIPLITVKLSNPGVSARELNEMAVEPLRMQLVQVSHLKSIDAQSKDGSAVIAMEFDYEANMDLLFVEVNEKIDRAISSLPSDMERPKVISASATDLPAFYINVSLKDHSRFNPDKPSEKLIDMSRFVNEVITRRIEQLPEVAMVDISGVISSEILVIPDAEKLKAVGVTTDQLTSALQNANVSLGNLTIRDGEYSFNVRFESKLVDKTDIEEIYLKIENRVFQFKDLATVSLQASERSGVVLSDGSEAITMAVIKRSESKMADLKESITTLMGHIEKDYPDLKFSMTRDQTALLDYSINNLISNILAGGLLACFIIFFFMRDFRSPLLVVFTIPTALVVSFLFFYSLGISINIISLAGLVLGLGMMVDNSIVVVDNITYRWQSGMSLFDACYEGTREVFMPMVSSVMTTCAVFIPLIFMSGISGALFYDQAMAVTITLVSALLVSTIVLPTLYYLFYKGKRSFTPNAFLSRIVKGNMIGVYERILKWNFRRRWVMWTIFFGSLLGILFVFVEIGKERLPELSYNDALVRVEWNERISAQENTRRCDSLVASLDTLVEQSTVMAGVHQFIMSHTSEQSISEAVIYLKTASPADIMMAQEMVQGYLAKNYRESVVEFSSSGNIFDMIFSSDDASLVANIRPVKGSINDLTDLNELLDKINRMLTWCEVPEVEWQQHIEFVARPEMLALYEVTYNELLSLLKSALRSNSVLTLASGSESLPIIIGGNSLELNRLIIENSIERDGYSIPLDRLMRQSDSRDLKSITSSGDGEYYRLNLNVDSEQVLSTIEAVEQIVRESENFEVDFSGSYFSNREMISELTYVLMISILLLYFILAAQFESLIQPLIILFELLIDIFGAMLVLWAFDVTLNLMSLIGIVVMCGIVINDSILKVDTINRMRLSGVGLIRSVMEAGARRLKPILMTSLTTILAMLPFLVKGDMGSDLQYPLSLAVIGGMVVGTLVSVFFVPLIYFEIYRRSHYNKINK